MADGSTSMTGEVSGEYNSSTTLDPSSNIQVAFATETSAYSINTDDYFVMSVILSNGEQSIYFVSPNL
jgi:hypothetical protein